jgi:hypothetical protein
MIQEVDNSVFETGKKEQPVYPTVNQFKLNVKVSNVVPGNVEENMEKHISTIFVDKFQVAKKPLSKRLLTETAWTTEEANEKEDLIFKDLNTKTLEMIFKCEEYDLYYFFHKTLWKQNKEDYKISFDFDVTLTGGKKSTMIYHFKNCTIDKLNDLCLSMTDTQKLNVVVDFKIGDYEVELK